MGTFIHLGPKVLPQHRTGAGRAPGMATQDHPIAIIGAGPAGLSTALAFQRISKLNTVVLERSETLPSGGTALGLWTNAWKALEVLGAAERLRQLHPMTVDIVELCRDNGRLLRRFSLSDCTGGPHEFRGVSRFSLINALFQELQDGAIGNKEIVKFGVTVEKVDASSSKHIDVLLSNKTTLRCSAVIGADGVGSKLLGINGRKAARFVGQLAIRGIASYPEGVPCLNIRQIWGERTRFGMYPISTTELYWFICFDGEEDCKLFDGTNQDKEQIKNEALKVIGKNWKWGVEDIICKTEPERMSRSRLCDRWDFWPLWSSVVPLAGQTAPNYHPLTTLVGDALHPMTPNLGQGGCTALEDGVILANAINKHASMARSFKEYEIERTKRCLPLTMRSWAMGTALHIPFPPVVAVRDAFISNLFDPSHFLDHACYSVDKAQVR